jgi:hypothetical protein
MSATCEFFAFCQGRWFKGSIFVGWTLRIVFCDRLLARHFPTRRLMGLRVILSVEEIVMKAIATIVSKALRSHPIFAPILMALGGLYIAEATKQTTLELATAQMAIGILVALWSLLLAFTPAGPKASPSSN